MVVLVDTLWRGICCWKGCFSCGGKSRNSAEKYWETWKRTKLIGLFFLMLSNVFFTTQIHIYMHKGHKQGPMAQMVTLCVLDIAQYSSNTNNSLKTCTLFAVLIKRNINKIRITEEVYLSLSSGLYLDSGNRRKSL